METYRSGDVAERCRWQMKRRLRSGRGRNFYTAVLKISGTATGHNGADLKHSRVCHAPISVNPLFIGAFWTSVCIFGNLHLAVFSQFRFWLCLYNFIWRRIEVVITGLTRNQLGSNPPRVRISPSPPKKKSKSCDLDFFLSVFKFFYAASIIHRGFYIGKKLL